MVHDMRFLRDRWKRITTESPIGANDGETVRQKANNQAVTDVRVESLGDWDAASLWRDKW
jgi:hypothetical protein